MKQSNVNDEIISEPLQSVVLFLDTLSMEINEVH
jgi:hypothetical protein